LRASGELAAKRRAAFDHRVRGLVLGALEARVDARVAALPGDRDPYAAAHEVLAHFGAAAPLGAAPRRHAGVPASVKGL
jgi:hypothetical protein